MTATKLLEKIKVLPPPEQAAFASLFHHWAEGSKDGGLVNKMKKQVQIPDYAARLRKLFPDGPIPGDSQAFWDELRAGRF